MKIVIIPVLTTNNGVTLVLYHTLSTKMDILKSIVLFYRTLLRLNFIIYFIEDHCKATKKKRGFLDHSINELRLEYIGPRGGLLVNRMKGQ